MDRPLRPLAQIDSIFARAPHAPAAIPARRSNWMDPLAELFIRLESHTNVNAMQFILVDGRIDRARLRAAIDRVVCVHPLLLAAPDRRGRRIEFDRWRPGDLPLYEHAWEEELDFASKPFRRFLTQLNESHPIRWRQMPPIQFHLVRSARSERTCFVMLTTHSIADARSEALLLDQLFATYGGAVPEEPGPQERSPDFASLDEVLPAQLSRGRRWRSFLSAQLHTLQMATIRDIGSRLTWTRAGRTAVRESLDFYHEILEPELEETIWSVAKATGHTLNTVVAAALSGVLADAAPSPKGRHVRFNLAFSLRPMAAAERQRDFRNFMVTCNLRVSSTADMMSLMSSIAEQVSALKKGRVFVDFEKIAIGASGLRRRGIDRIFLKMIHRVQGTTVSYSNPGVVELPLLHFGDPALPIVAYIASGCVVPPLHMIIGTPSIRGRIHLNATYKVDAIEDFEGQVVRPLKQRLKAMAAQVATKSRLRARGLNSEPSASTSAAQHLG